MPSSRQLQILYQIVLTGSITEAARRMGVSQPAISIALRQLETRVGMALFIRRGGRLIPTPETEALFDELRVINERIERVSARLGQQAGLQAGHVTLAVNAAVMNAEIVSAIARFRECHPGIRISIRRLTSRQIAGQVENGEVDFGITYGRNDSARVASKVFRETQIVCVAPRGMFGAAGGTVTAEDLVRTDDKRFISYPRGSMMGRLIHDAMSVADPSWTPEVTVNDALVGCLMVEAGAGVALLVRNLSLERVFPDIAFLPLAPLEPVRIILQTHPSRVLSHAAMRLIAEITGTDAAG